MKASCRRRETASFRSRNSSALVIVLACLAIITVMIVAFFGSVTTERQSAKTYASGASVKLVADSAVDIVMGQIKDATKGTDAGGNTLAWASQPGMIRTYDTAAQPSAYFKLYSWANMIGSGGFNPADTSELPPSTWASSPALYTDLNDPVGGIYPIVDPAAASFVQGFSISAANCYPTATDAAPMPVQWLYVLKDGSIATAAGGVGKTVTVTSTSGTAVSATNPIVARMAFWTDDDSSKVNINTAAGDVWTTAASAPAPGAAGNPGSFWDIPRTADTDFEKTYLAKNQPAQNEYQRYPGHPATTYLSAVFTNLTTADINKLIPRVAPGGSTSGTAIATSPITPDSDRLYASVDEFVFTTNVASSARTPNTPFSPAKLEQAKFFLTAHSRAPEVNLFNEPRLLLWPLNVQTTDAYRTPFDKLIAFCGTLNNYIYYFQRKGYVTGSAGADSPSVDLPGTSDLSSTLKRNRQLMTYLQNLTSLPIPGFSTSGATFSSKYSAMERDQILTEMFDYIRVLNASDTSISGLVPYAPSPRTGTIGTGSTGGGGNYGQGQVVPILNWDTTNAKQLRGFGRFPTVREAVLVFVGVGQTQGTLKSNVKDVTTTPAIPNLDTTDIPDGKTRVQAFFTLNFFDPSQGYALVQPNFQVRVTGLKDFKWVTSTTSMGFNTTPYLTSVRRDYNNAIYGGYMGASSYIGDSSYRVVSAMIDMPTGGTFSFRGGDLLVEILDAGGTVTLQKLTINIPDGTFPVPQLAPRLKDATNADPTYPALTMDYRILTKFTSTIDPTAVYGRFTGSNSNNAYSDSSKTWICGKDTVRSVVANTDPRIIAGLFEVDKSYFSPIEPQYSNSSIAQVHSVAEATRASTATGTVGAWLGKLVPNLDYGTPSGTGNAAILAADVDFTYSGPTPTPTGDGLQPNAVPRSPALYSAPIVFGMNGGNCVAANGVYAGVNATPSSGNTLPNPPGDWDTGMSVVMDGAFINKADEGSISGLTLSPMRYPYYDNLNSAQTAGGTYFTPNRQVTSAVMFGSLPTGVISNKPWQTLLFRPSPGGTPQHLGAQNPPDYLLLDLFNMPVVEPYAISDPFSTAGKINMNYQIVPFTYINRSTALQAVLKPEQLLLLSSKSTDPDSKVYKTYTNVNSINHLNRRKFLDIDQTLKGFENRFATHDIFRSASEICSIWLVPQGQTYAQMENNFWKDYLLTGDNVREKPYGNLYPRLTTKSNTYTVHCRVQTLKKIKGTADNQWVEGTDLVASEYRGSSTLERYLDTADPNIPDYVTEPQPVTAGKAIDNFYKFRVIETKQFTP